jgi:hypothetical protein
MSTDSSRLARANQNDLINYSIFKFNFRLETVSNALAVYVEANGQRRYCYGPGGDQALYDACRPDNAADPAPVNPY